MYIPTNLLTTYFAFAVVLPLVPKSKQLVRKTTLQRKPARPRVLTYSCGSCVAFSGFLINLTIHFLVLNPCMINHAWIKYVYYFSSPLIATIKAVNTAMNNTINNKITISSTRKYGIVIY